MLWGIFLFPLCHESIIARSAVFSDQSCFGTQKIDLQHDRFFLPFQSLLQLRWLSPSDLLVISSFSNLEHLELGDCVVNKPKPDAGDATSSTSLDLFQAISGLTKLRKLRLVNCRVASDLGELRWLSQLEQLELVDVELREGFGQVGMRNLPPSLKRLLVIPVYKDEVRLIFSRLFGSVSNLFYSFRLRQSTPRCSTPRSH